MSASTGKLDQSLDEIMKDGKTTRGARGGRADRGRGRAPRRAQAAKAAAPSGGIQKSTRTSKALVPTAPANIASTSGESKIIVSGLPDDVNETQIKDYFSKTIGHVKRAMLTYGPNGRSRGVATIIFRDTKSAAKAVSDLNGVKVDTRTMKIEVVLDASNVSASAPKTLSDRIAKPKNAAREATKQKEKTAKTATTATATDAPKSGRNKKKSGRAGKPKAKTAEELDAEMQDYFGGENAPPAATNGDAAMNGAAQPAATATGGDAMDEIS